MYGLAPVQVSHHVRSASALWGSGALATFGLLLVIWGCVRAGRSGSTAVAVGAYIAAAYFFTSSTSFANPAVTLGRTLTDTFSGIRPADVVAFIPAQLASGRDPTASVQTLRDTLYHKATAHEAFSALAAFLFTHNSQIAIFAFIVRSPNFIAKYILL